MNGWDLEEIIRTLFGVGASVGVQVICALIAAAIYAAKGKSWVGGALLGFFLGPLGVFIAIVSGPWQRGPRQMPRPMPPPPPPANTYVPPRPTNVYVPSPQPRRTTYRLPGRCPNCNGPLHQRDADARSVTCWYCGSLIDGTPVPD